MSKSEGKAAESTPKKRAHRFVPVDEAPVPGLSPRAREVLALLLCGVAVYGMLSLATFRLADPGASIPTEGAANLGGVVGYYLALGFTITLGLAGWVPFVLLLLGSLWLFVGRSCERVAIKALGAIVFAAMLSILFAGADGTAVAGDTTPYGAGGNFGRVVSPELEAAFGGTGRLLLVGFGALVALLIATEWMFSELLLRGFAGLERLWKRLLRREGAPVVVGAGGESATVDADGEDAGDDASNSSRRRRRARSATSEEALEGEAGSGRNGRRAPVAAADDGEEGAADDQSGAAADAEANDGPGKRRRRSRANEAAEAGPSESAGEAAADEQAHDDEEPVVEAGADEGRRKGRRRASDDGAGGTDAARGSAEAEREPKQELDEVLEPTSTPVVVPPPAVLLPKPKPKQKPKKTAQTTLPFEDYPFPPIELFQEPVGSDASATGEALARGGQAIVNKLANFGIKAEIVEVSVGPAVTQYELRLDESIRVNKVAGFESDLAAALKAVSVRVVAPIPGKDTIGIEVPNGERQKVYMRDLLDQFGRSEDLAIPLYLGKDVGGNPIVEDLAKMPHLLIAGTTGSGKSVCINTILLSVLMTRTPEQVKLILVDPKMVELQAYKRVPHLCCDVVTNMKKAPGVLQWAVDEMENRYALLSAAGVNHIKNYNRLGQQELQKRLQREPDPERVQLSYVVIVIDEFADLMNVAANEVEELIQRLAQKSRAVGMHVILATQRPSSEVITGIIKANLPCQIAFKVNRRIDSRVILDANGAEKLLGFGDMLYMPPGGGALLRAQGTFVADDEMQAVVRFLEEKGQKPSFTPALVQTQGSSRPSIADSDERYREAVEIILGQQRGSATLLQRALAVGYTRATRLLELMEEDGLVGPFVGSKSRDVLMTLEEYHAREELREAAAAEGEAADGDEAEAAEEADADGVAVAADDGEDPNADASAEDGDASLASAETGGGERAARSSGDDDAEASA